MVLRLHVPQKVIPKALVLEGVAMMGISSHSSANIVSTDRTSVAGVALIQKSQWLSLAELVPKSGGGTMASQKYDDGSPISLMEVNKVIDALFGY